MEVSAKFPIETIQEQIYLTCLSDSRTDNRCVLGFQETKRAASGRHNSCVNKQLNKVGEQAIQLKQLK